MCHTHFYVLVPITTIVFNTLQIRWEVSPFTNQNAYKNIVAKILREMREEKNIEPLFQVLGDNVSLDMNTLHKIASNMGNVNDRYYSDKNPYANLKDTVLHALILNLAKNMKDKRKTEILMELINFLPSNMAGRERKYEPKTYILSPYLEMLFVREDSEKILKQITVETIKNIVDYSVLQICRKIVKCIRKHIFNGIFPSKRFNALEYRLFQKMFEKPRKPYKDIIKGTNIQPRKGYSLLNRIKNHVKFIAIPQANIGGFKNFFVLLEEADPEELLNIPFKCPFIDVYECFDLLCGKTAIGALLWTKNIKSFVEWAKKKKRYTTRFLACRTSEWKFNTNLNLYDYQNGLWNLDWEKLSEWLYNFLIDGQWCYVIPEAENITPVENISLDDIDIKIISLLRSNYRLSTSKIAKVVGISNIQAWRRVKRILESNILMPIVFPLRMGLEEDFLLYVKCRKEIFNPLMSLLKELPYVLTSKIFSFHIHDKIYQEFFARLLLPRGGLIRFYEMLIPLLEEGRIENFGIYVIKNTYSLDYLIS